MKHLAVASIVITALVLCFLSDLNFADGTPDAEGWDTLANVTLVGGLVWFAFAGPGGDT